MVVWRHTNGMRCFLPFYGDALANAGGARCQTGLEELEQAARLLPARQPDGFVFHLSRCGSTLVSQMLAAVPRHTVLSEPEPLNDILWPEDAVALPDENRRAELLEMVVRVMARQRTDGGAVFVKCDAWHLLDVPLFRRVFPRVPVAFVYRDPLEILVSHRRQPGSHVVPGLLDAGRLGVPVWEPATGMDGYAAQVLARLMEAALTHLPEEALLINYTELPSPGRERLLQHFQVEVTPDEQAAMLAVTGSHAKHRGLPFTPDSAERQAGADPALRSLAAEHTARWYDLLERRRAGELRD